MKHIAKNLYQHENGTYYSLHRRGSRQFKKSLGTKDRALAKALLRQSASAATGVLCRDTNAGSGTAPLSDPTAVLRPDFLVAVEQHEQNTAFASPSTARNLQTRKRTMLRFCTAWSEFQPVSIWKRFDAEGWISAQNQLRWYLRSFSNFCVNQGWLSASQIAGKIPRKTVPPRRIQIPSPQLVSDLLLMCEAENKECGEFIRWMALSGLRLSGAAGIDWSEISFSLGEYKRRMKGGSEVVIPLLPEALGLLEKRWLASGQPKTGLVFSLGDARIKRVRRLLRKYAVGLGIGLTYPHALRHHFASVAFAAGFSAGEVALMLGHKDGGALALRVYGHVIPSQLKQKVSTLRMVA